MTHDEPNGLYTTLGAGGRVHYWLNGCEMDLGTWKMLMNEQVRHAHEEISRMVKHENTPRS